MDDLEHNFNPQTATTQLHSQAFLRRYEVARQHEETFGSTLDPTFATEFEYNPFHELSDMYGKDLAIAKYSDWLCNSCYIPDPFTNKPISFETFVDRYFRSIPANEQPYHDKAYLRDWDIFNHAESALHTQHGTIVMIRQFGEWLFAKSQHLRMRYIKHLQDNPAAALELIYKQRGI